MNKIAFIDRDGCLIHEPNDFQVDRLDKIRLMKDVIPSLLKLKTSGYKLIMVSNQDGLGSKSFPQEDFDLCHSFMLNIFESQGVIFDEILICPHFSEDECQCRKPKTGLLTEYLKDSNWLREESFMVGDRETDLELARNLGVQGYLISPSRGWADIVTTQVDKPRRSSVQRKTKETDIKIDVDLDGTGMASIQSGIGFLDHMLESFTKHSKFNIKIVCNGDTWVDEHHTTEDIALALGEAISQAIGDKRGIQRFGFLLPMDEALAQIALDLSGRSFFAFDGEFSRESVGGLPTELVPHFFHSLSEALKANLHIKISGENEHHKIEAMFKGVAKALSQATARPNPGEGDIPSTKGTL